MAIAKTRAVHHAAHVAVEPDVVDVVLVGLDVERVFLAGIAERCEVGVAAQRVVVEVHLGVGGQQPPVRGDDQGVDLNEAAIERFEHVVEVGEERAAGANEGFGEAERGGGAPAHVGLEADDGVDGDALDLLRRARGDLFDIHAAGLADDEDGAALGGVDGDGGVELLLDADRFLDDHALHGDTLRPRLVGDQSGS